MWLRIATTIDLESTAQILQDQLDRSEVPMPIESLSSCEPGKVAAVVTGDSVQFSRFATEEFDPPANAEFLILRT